MIYNDADIEMIELRQRADEDAAETCWDCGIAYDSVTFYLSPRGARPVVEVYECSCGHRSVWINARRLS